jgi:hypothetical protein
VIKKEKVERLPINQYDFLQQQLNIIITRTWGHQTHLMISDICIWSLQSMETLRREGAERWSERREGSRGEAK